MKVKIEVPFVKISRPHFQLSNQVRGNRSVIFVGL